MSETIPVPFGLPMERDAGPFAPPTRVSRLRDARPVSPMIFPDGHEGWFVTGYDAVRRLLADTRFSSRQDLGPLHLPNETRGSSAATGPSPQIPGLFVGMDPPDHTRLRRKLVGAFTVRRMKQLEARIVDIAERQLDEMARLVPPVDLVTAFALPIPSLVICELLGVPYGDRETFQQNSARFLEQEASPREKLLAYTVLTAYLDALMAQKRAEPGEDVLSDLARQEDVTDQELVGIAFLLLLAGHDSTANLLALGTWALLEHPTQLALLRDEPELIGGAVEELLRFLSQADIFLRYATEDIELGGATIRRGSTVVISLLAANHDPKRFEHPGTLDIRRTARGHLSFGHGVHQCLGHQLARIQIRAAVGGLVRRFPDLELAVPTGSVRLKPDMNNHGVHELPVTWSGPGGTSAG